MYEGWKGMDMDSMTCSPSCMLSEMNLVIYWYGEKKRRKKNQQKLISAMQYKKNDNFFQIFEKKTQTQSMKYFAYLGVCGSTAEKKSH